MSAHDPKRSFEVRAFDNIFMLLCHRYPVFNWAVQPKGSALKVLHHARNHMPVVPDRMNTDSLPLDQRQFSRRTVMASRYAVTILAVLCACVLAAGIPFANEWAIRSVPFKALLAGLGAEDSTTRARSAQFLGLRGRVEAVRPLIGLLDGAEENAQVRSAEGSLAT